jgi:ABC-type transport system substrate-binding protein
MRFTCLIPENFALWERIGLLVQRNLAAIGVDMTLEALPAEQFNERIASGDFDAVLVDLIVGNTASRPFTFWYSDSPQNVWGYQNPKTDFALDQLRRAPDESTYRQAFRNFQLESLQAAPAIFIALGETARAVSKRFQVVAPPGSDIVRTIADWRLAQPPTRDSN